LPANHRLKGTSSQQGRRAAKIATTVIHPGGLSQALSTFYDAAVARHQQMSSIDGVQDLFLSSMSSCTFPGDAKGYTAADIALPTRVQRSPKNKPDRYDQIGRSS
jgi:hypothetical protein